MALDTTFTAVFAVPGESHIIDAVHPETGLSQINGHTLEQIQARYPDAVLMAWEDYRAAQIARQDTPLIFDPTTAEQYDEMLCVLPPAAWMGGAFLVGEPDDHSMATGRPRFRMYRKRGTSYEVGSRPVTVAEFRALVQAAL